MQRRVANDELTAVGSVSLADGKAVWKGFWGPVCVRLKKAIGLLTVHYYRESPWQQGSKFILVVLPSMRRDFAVKLAGNSTQSVLSRSLMWQVAPRAEGSWERLRGVERGWEGLAMSSELLATYSGLGVRDGEEYYKGEECLGEDVCFSFRWWDDQIHVITSSHHSTWQF